jgi:hypothetical protein
MIRYGARILPVVLILSSARSAQELAISRVTKHFGPPEHHGAEHFLEEINKLRHVVDNHVWETVP